MAKKKTNKRKTTKKTDSPTVAEYKPTLHIDSKNLASKSLKVGKKARVLVSGTIVEESLRDWEAKGRKSYKLEINDLRIPKKKR